MTMEQVAWAVTGLLAAALLGNFWFLGAKIDSINSRIDTLSARLDARIDALAATGQTHIERHPN